MTRKQLEMAAGVRPALELEITQLDKDEAIEGPILADLENTADLADPAQLAKIGGLQIKRELRPRRKAAKLVLIEQADVDELAVANRYIRDNYAPRQRAYEERVRSKVRAALFPHFSDAVELERAIESASAVRSAGALSVSLNDNPLSGAQRFVAELLKLDGALARLEKE